MHVCDSQISMWSPLYPLFFLKKTSANSIWCPLSRIWEISLYIFKCFFRIQHAMHSKKHKTSTVRRCLNCENTIISSFVTSKSHCCNIESCKQNVRILIFLHNHISKSNGIFYMTIKNSIPSTFYAKNETRDSTHNVYNHHHFLGFIRKLSFYFTYGHQSMVGSIFGDLWHTENYMLKYLPFHNIEVLFIFY